MRYLYYLLLLGSIFSSNYGMKKQKIQEKDYANVISIFKLLKSNPIEFFRFCKTSRQSIPFETNDTWTQNLIEKYRLLEDDGTIKDAIRRSLILATPRFDLFDGDEKDFDPPLHSEYIALCQKKRGTDT